MHLIQDIKLTYSRIKAIASALPDSLFGTASQFDRLAALDQENIQLFKEISEKKILAESLLDNIETALKESAPLRASGPFDSTDNLMQSVETA
mmetsp:Transcript_10700/g.28054  ORF Transcript_10700/g.28054 Transcript_10700/m.28054 type:complete len:93 (+) Transcript_10700:368-646(+)